MPYAHQTLAAGRWSVFSLAEQLANVGSEVGRAIAWKTKGDAAYSQQAFERALELIDLTIADPRWRTRLKELCRMREVVCDFFVGDNQYHGTSASLENYFYAFNYAARRQK